MNAKHMARRIASSARRRTSERLLEGYVRWMGIAAARNVTTPARFAANELFLRRRIAQYTLRRTRRTLFVRHPMADAPIVSEVLNGASYVAPREVASLLAAVAAPRIIDLGAHVGTSTLMLLEQFPTARIVSLEPHPETADLLRRMVAANGIGDRCEVHQVAAGTHAATTTMEGSSFLAHLSRSTDNVQEAVDLMPSLAKYQELDRLTEVEVVDVIPMLANADLVKMDIEGSEWPILQDPRFAQLKIAAITLEYHPFEAPAEDTRAAATELLTSAGFTVAPPVVDHGTNGVLWAWRS